MYNRSFCIKKGLQLGCKQFQIEEILMHLLGGISYTDLYLQNFVLNEKEYCTFNEMINRVLANEPIAYITNFKHFYKHDFKVSKNTLIPRLETEILVNEVVKFCRQKSVKNFNILDIGTGTGCIIISIIKELLTYNYNVKGTAIDVSQSAIDIAIENAKALHVIDKIHYQCCDMMNYSNHDSENFNIIVSNPPYIASKDIQYLESSVKNYEPYLALCGGENGLFFYEQIALLLNRLKLKNYLFCIECGINQAFDIKKIFSNLTFSNVIKDILNVERILIYDEGFL